MTAATIEMPVEQGEMNPLAIINHMVQQNVSVDVLERMMALAERYDQNNARVAFASAMTEAQSEMPVVVRDAENRQTNSKYARLETVAKQIKPIYLKHGFSLTFSEADCNREGYVRLCCKVRHRDGHIEEHHLDGPIDDTGLKGNKNKTALHGTASTWTYLERLLTCRIFNVTIADTDDDGAGAGDKGVITEEQANWIMNVLFDLARKRGKEEPDYNAFLKWCGVKPMEEPTREQFALIISDMPVSEFEKVERQLKAQMAKEGVK